MPAPRRIGDDDGKGGNMQDATRGTADHGSVDGAHDANGDREQRRSSDRKSVVVLGWVACLVLSASLIYVFVRSLIDGPEEVDPIFLGLQTLASSLFLWYAIRLRNKVFMTANVVAIAAAVGTLVLLLLKP